MNYTAIKTHTENIGFHQIIEVKQQWACSILG